MKFLRRLFACLGLALAAASLSASVYETNSSSSCVVKTVSVAMEEWWLDAYYNWYSYIYYSDYTLNPGDSLYLEDDTSAWDHMVFYNVSGITEDSIPGCGEPTETWESFDEPQGWSYGSWSPDCSGTPDYEWLEQSRTNTQWHYYGERSNLGNVRNTGWYQESDTEYQSVQGCQSSSWSSFEEVQTDWHEVSSSPSCSGTWEDQTFTQNYDEERTVRRGERDQWGNERNVSIDTESRSGTRTESGCRPLNWHSFETVTVNWHEISSSPPTSNYPTGTSFTQNYTEERSMRGGQTNDRGDESGVTTWTETRSGTRTAVGTGANTPPAASLSGSTQLAPGETGNWSFGVTDSDANLFRWRFGYATGPNDTMTAQWSAVSGGSASGTYSTAFAEVGDYKLKVEVEDASGAASSTTLSIAVRIPNELPSAYLVLDIDQNPDADAAVLLTNDPLYVTAHAADSDGNLSSMGVRWLNHDLRQWWTASGYDETNSYTEIMNVPANTEYFRGEAWDTTSSGVAGDWQAVVVLGTWIPNLAVTTVTPNQSGSILITYSDAPDTQTWIGVYPVGQSSNYSPLRSATVPNIGNGTMAFTLGTGFTVGQQYHARMFPMGTYGEIAISNTFTPISDNPVFSLSVTGGSVGGRSDEDGNSGNGVFVTSGWHTGDVASITATPAAGQTFDRWSMNGAGNGTLGPIFSPSTTFTIGTTDGGVQAIYQQPPSNYLVTVNGGHAIPAGPQPAGTVLSISADPPAGQMFSSWAHSSGPGTLASTTTSNTTFTVGAGAASVTASFVGNAPPVISSHPVNKNALPGATANFSVTASGSPVPTYQWRKNGAVLANGGNVSGATTATLTLTNVQLEDEASYSVTVTNANGSVISNPAELVIFQIDSDGDGVPDSMEIQMGTNKDSPGTGDTSNATKLKIHRPLP